jgi:hypothetical protein
VASTSFPNDLDYPLNIFQYLMVPEAQGPESLPPEPGFPFLVLALLPGMLPAVKLDDESCLKTHEIGDVLTNGLLAAELEPVDLLAPEMPPQEFFGVGLSLSQ